MPASSADTVPSPLGRSLALVDGDLAFDARGTLRLVTGADNFLQSMRLAVQTPLGSDLFYVGYGFDVESTFTTPGKVREIKEIIRLNLVRTLSLDDRVQSVREVVFHDEPRYAEIVAGGGVPQPGGRASARDWRAVAVLEVVGRGDLPVALSGAQP